MVNVTMMPFRSGIGRQRGRPEWCDRVARPCWLWGWRAVIQEVWAPLDAEVREPGFSPGASRRSRGLPMP